MFAITVEPRMFDGEVIIVPRGQTNETEDIAVPSQLTVSQHLNERALVSVWYRGFVSIF